MKNINKIFALIICSAMALSLIGCSSDKANNDDETNDTKKEEVQNNSTSEDKDKEDSSSPSEETSANMFEMNKMIHFGKWKIYYPETAVNVNSQSQGYAYIEDDVALFYFYTYRVMNTEGVDLPSLTIDELMSMCEEDLLHELRHYFYSAFDYLDLKNVTVEPAGIEGIDAYFVRGQIGDGNKMDDSDFVALYVLDDEIPYVLWCSYFYHSLEEDHDTWVVQEKAPSIDVLEEFVIELQNTFEVDEEWLG